MISETPSSPQTIENTMHIIPLQNHVIVELSGPDASAFLQGQTTNDVDALKPGELQLSAHCNHKGRMISSFMLASIEEQRFFLRLHESIADIAVTALNKYLVFSKAEIKKTTLQPYVLIGSRPPERTEDTQYYCLKPEHAEIYLEQNQSSNIAELFPNTPICDPEEWDKTLIQKAWFELQKEHSELFLPQELNFDAIGAVNFKKGCYTGQEIIARLHYRGQSKKRLFRGQVCLSEGTELTESEVFELDKTKSCGNVLVSTKVGTNTYEFLAVANVSSITNECVLGLTNCAKIEWDELPYAIP